jgi:hypothetical protein
VSRFLQLVRTQRPKSRSPTTYRRNTPLIGNVETTEDSLRYAKGFDPNQNIMFSEEHTEIKGFQEMIGVYSAPNS